MKIITINNLKAGYFMQYDRLIFHKSLHASNIIKINTKNIEFREDTIKSNFLKSIY